MSTFERAIGLGCTHIETDVHATADGVVVVFHDETLDRITGRAGRVDQTRHRDLAGITVNGESVIPKLEDVLAAWPDIRLNIDVKADSAVGPVLDVLARTGARPRVCIASFSDRRLRTIRAASGPDLATSAGPMEVAAILGLAKLRRLGDRANRVQRKLAARLARLVPDNVPCVQVPARAGVNVVDQHFVDLAHEQGRQVHVWTINDEREMRRLLDLGVDGIVSDNLEAALAVTQEPRPR